MKKKLRKKLPPLFLVNIILKMSNFFEKLHRKILPPQLVLIDYSMSYIVLHKCLSIAAKLKIADILKDGPMNIVELAKKTETEADVLYRIMRALSSKGVFKEKKDKIFETSKLGKYLQSDISDTMLYFTRITSTKWLNDIWGDLLKTAKNGKSFFDNNLGISFFEWLEKHPEDQVIFDEGMTSISSQSDIPVASAYNFSCFDTIIDIGGGRGGQIAAILETYPNVKGILFDQPLTIGFNLVNACFGKPELSGRIEFIEGNFFSEIPAKYDAYLMKSILHDWNDEKALEILKNCRKAMSKGSTLIIIENIVGDEMNESDLAKFLDINVLALMGGHVRSRNENAHLIEKAGFKVTRFIPTFSPFSIIEAMPV